MSTFGYTSTPSYGYIYDQTQNLAASYVGTMPSPGGYVTQIHVYCASYPSNCSGYLCLWDGSGTLLTSVSVSLTTTEGWVTGNLSNYYVASGSNLLVGVMAVNQGTNGLEMYYDSNGNYKWDWGHNSTVPGNIANFTQYTSQALGAYITYTAVTAPTVSNVTPNPVAPGQQITLTGTGFLHASGVTCGGVACTSLNITSDTSMTCYLASSTPGGTQGVVVTNPAGTNTAYNITVGGIAWVNTGTPSSPVWTQGVVYVNTGTPSSPVWTVAAPVEVWNGSSWVVAS